MTREEKVNTLKAIIQECEEHQQQRKEALFEIIKDLEQEPCTDCISRQAVLEKAKDYGGQTYLIPVNSVKALPPVTAQQKMGHWIRVDKNKLRCSECDIIHLIAQYPLGKIDWCPNCGTKMQENKE